MHVPSYVHNFSYRGLFRFFLPELNLTHCFCVGLLGVSDLEDLKLAEELGRTCYEMYNVTATGLAPEIAYFNIYVRLPFSSILQPHIIRKLYNIPLQFLSPFNQGSI